MVDYTDVNPNEVPLLYQVPQYVIMTMGEILFSISGLTFAYSQVNKGLYVWGGGTVTDIPRTQGMGGYHLSTR